MHYSSDSWPSKQSVDVLYSSDSQSTDVESSTPDSEESLERTSTTQRCQTVFRAEDVRETDITTTQGRMVTTRLTANMATFINAMRRLNERIQHNPREDTVDIVLILDARGKSQTMALVHFLNTLEEAIRSKTGIPTARLAWIIDTVVGYRAAAIPAIAMALGDANVIETLPVVAAMQTTRIEPEDPEPRCCWHICDSVRTMTQAQDAVNTCGAGATAGTVPLIRDELANSEQNQRLLAQIGQYTSSDLVVRCVVPGQELGENLVGAMLRAAANRDRGYDGVGLAGSIAAMGRTILGTASAGGDTFEVDTIQESANRAMYMCVAGQHVGSPHESTQITPADLRDELTDGARTTTNTIVVTLSVNTHNGAITLVGGTNKTEQARNGTEQVVCNIQLTIPNKLSKKGNKSMVDWQRMHAQINEIVGGRGNSIIALTIRELIKLFAAEITRAAAQVNASNT
ncbi:MAG: hypothetical protein LBD43_01790 [Holosporales bacterium]|jgi:hypothetical protein|nr:hypothetical protein [Holosporales bacterium]